MTSQISQSSTVPMIRITQEFPIMSLQPPTVADSDSDSDSDSYGFIEFYNTMYGFQ